MNLRLLACVSLLSLAASGPAALASPHKTKDHPKAVCNLVSDPGADAIVDPTIGLAKKGLQDNNADIRSADIASDATYVTVVIRVKSLATPDAAWPEAHGYLVQWSVPGHATPVYLGATLDPNPAAAVAYGPQFVFGDELTFKTPAVVFTGFNIDSAAKVKGTVDKTNATVTLSVPISQLGGYGTFKPGTRFDAVTAMSQVLINAPNTPKNLPLFGGSLAQGMSTPDTDTATKPYIAGTPSCIKPGS